jgi:hypothetical protein
VATVLPVGLVCHTSVAYDDPCATQVTYEGPAPVEVFNVLLCGLRVLSNRPEIIHIRARSTEYYSEIATVLIVGTQSTNIK